MISLLSLSACSILGQNPKGERLQRVEASPHYIDGEFHNAEPTEMNTGGTSTLENFWNFLFMDTERLRPEIKLSRAGIDFKELDQRQEDLLIWLGHSSLYLQLDGRRMLVDPVFLDYAAPLSMFNKAFDGQAPYSAADFAALGLDLVILTHDHYDHLEMESIKELARHNLTFLVPLGAGQHLEYWGVDPGRIIEGDWGDQVQIGPYCFDFVTARHFSGRFIARNKTLWTGYVITRPDGRQIYLSGDSGYGRHFAEIGRKFPNIELTLIECGQYNANWALIHMFPEECAKAIAEVGSPRAIPLHSGRFALSSHPWDEPWLRLDQASRSYDYELLTPRMDEIVFLDGREQHFSRWWLEDARKEAEFIRQNSKKQPESPKDS